MTERPAPAAQGTLSKTPFAHLLLYMREKRLTGTLALQVLQGPAELLGESLLAFEKGQVAQVKLPRPLDALGEVMVAEGLISMRLLQATLPRVLAGQGLQGQLLKVMGALDDAGIERGMRLHVRRKVRRLFALRDGDYQYFNGVELLAGYGRERYPEDVLGVLWEGVKLHANLTVVDTWLGRLASNGVAFKSTRAELERLHLQPEDITWVELLVEGPVLFESWLERAGDPRSARLLAYVLMISRMVEPASATGARVLPSLAAPARGPGLGVVRESRAMPTQRISGNMAAVRISGPHAALKTGEHRALPGGSGTGEHRATSSGGTGSGEHRSVAGVNSLSSFASVNDDLPLPPPDPEALSAAPVAPSSRPAPARPSAAAAPAVAARPSQADLRTSAAEARLVALQDENYFEMLGVTRMARDEEIREAFLKAATQWHPDRAPSSNPALRTAHERIFGLLNDAQATLLDPDQRGRYQATVNDGGGTPSSQRKVAAVLEAATEMHKAEVYFKRREFAECERVARQVLTVTPDDSNLLSLLAAVLTETHPNGPYDEALKHLQEAVRVSPGSDRAQYQLGALYKRMGQPDRAEAHFRAAASANPKNIDAQREVRVLAMRARNSSMGMPAQNPDSAAPAASKVGDLLSKWFKK